ncbi:MAG: hypothetical protein LBT48_06360 [Prevotellaceae bacterium]|jgi:hypothetical protein|nr:hypothetical protein [Prevotellaceae bacterium]
MSTTRYQPTKDADFIAWVTNIKNNCLTNQTQWDLKSSDTDKLLAYVDNAVHAYEVNINPELKNRHTSMIKKEAFITLKTFMSLFTLQLLADELISDAEIEAMGLRPRQHHASLPLPDPTEAPEITAVVGQHHDVTVYVSVAQHGHPAEYLKKKGYAGFILRYRKEGDSEWHQELSTKLHTMLLFDAEDEGKHVTLTVAWINPRLEHGPWSDETTTLIN